MLKEIVYIKASFLLHFGSIPYGYGGLGSYFKIPSTFSLKVLVSKQHCTADFPGLCGPNGCTPTMFTQFIFVSLRTGSLVFVHANCIQTNFSERTMEDLEFFWVT